MDKVKKGFIYTRVSSDEQVENGGGLEVQKKQCREFCRQHGIGVVAEFAEEGVSGTLYEDRPVLQEMLSQLENVDCVVCKDTTRLWRDGYPKEMIHSKLKAYGKDIKSVANPDYTIYTKGVARFLNTVVEGIDVLEKDVIVERLTSGKRERASQGYRSSGKTPFGYRYASRDGKKTVEPDRYEAPIVKDIFNGYLRLGSIGKVRKQLQEGGHQSRNGKEFSAQSIANILRNRFYVGDLKFDGIKSKGKHQAIISRVVFGKVQKALDRNRRNRER